MTAARLTLATLAWLAALTFAVAVILIDPDLMTRAMAVGAVAGLGWGLVRAIETDRARDRAMRRHPSSQPAEPWWVPDEPELPYRPIGGDK